MQRYAGLCVATAGLEGPGQGQSIVSREVRGHRDAAEPPPATRQDNTYLEP